MANILVVDDQPDILGLVWRTLNRDNHDIVLADSVEEAREAVRAQVPDLVVLDVMMPKEDGITYCRELRSTPATRTLPILFLSARGKADHIVEGLDAGGDDYMVKPFQPSVLNARVRALLRRHPPGERQDFIKAGGMRLDTNTCQVSVNGGEPVQLTLTEFKLLEHLMRHPGQPQSVQALLDSVWEYPPGTGDPDLVRAHVRNLRAKIEPDPPNYQYILTLHGVGYMVKD